MAKQNEGILYLVLTIAVAGLLYWLWSKHSVTLASVQAAAAAGSATVALTPSGVFSSTLVDMNAPL